MLIPPCVYDATNARCRPFRQVNWPTHRKQRRRQPFEMRANDASFMPALVDVVRPPSPGFLGDSVTDCADNVHIRPRRWSPAHAARICRSAFTSGWRWQWDLRRTFRGGTAQGGRLGPWSRFSFIMTNKRGRNEGWQKMKGHCRILAASQKTGL